MQKKKPTTATDHKELNLGAIIVVPDSATPLKCNSMECYGARVEKVAWDLKIEKCSSLATETGYSILEASDNYDVIEGQATVAMELLQQVPQLDAILVSLGAGGLASGITFLAKTLKPSIKVYLVEPEGKLFEQCLQSGDRVLPAQSQSLETVAEGLRHFEVGAKAFPILHDLAEKTVITVNDTEIIEAMKLVFHYMKQVVEGASGATVAALLKFTFPPDIKNIGLVLCGGNIDCTKLPWYPSP